MTALHRADIAFDAVSSGNCCFESGLGILDDPVFHIVQPAVGDRSEECCAVEHGSADLEDGVDLNTGIQGQARDADG